MSTPASPEHLPPPGQAARAAGRNQHGAHLRAGRFGSLDRATALRLLRGGEMVVRGRLLNASNATLFCSIRLEGPPPQPAIVADCIYKPRRGERPLFDFPDGTLARREVAAYELSAASGLDVVPPTVLRDGPFGEGMVQLWIDVDERVDVTELLRAGDLRLRRIALFDAVANNADRKGGHLLPTPTGHVYGVDHGICFAVEPKLRTILWQWRGQRLSPGELGLLNGLLEGLRGDLGARLRTLLAPAEVRATIRRVDRLISEGRFPLPDPDRPAIPWPPF